MFDSERLYRPDDPALRVIAAKQTMAQWRSRGEGPRYHKLGPRILYKGRDLNNWLERQLVGTVDQPRAA